MVNKYASFSCQSGDDDDNIECNTNSRYPAYDGSCNNLAYPSRGMGFACHRRLLPPDYADGVVALRASVSGAPLPNPRLLSNELMPEINEIDPELTQLNMQWGQFVVHDTVRTPISLANAPECCPQNLPPGSPPSTPHPECERIEPFPPGDVLTQIFNQTCVRNTRSNSCPRCRLGK